MNRIEQDAGSSGKACKAAEALKILTSALRNKETSELWNDWASMAFACGDSDLAESGYRRALQLEPSHRQASVNLTALLLGQGRLDESVPLLQTLVGRLTEDEARVLQRLAAGAKDRTQGSREVVASIIIPVWNQLKFTRQCVARLRETTPQHLYELVFIDNGSQDGTAEFLAHLGGNTRVITNSENLGFGTACNEGAAVARGKYLVFLNNDTAPHPGWLEALLETAGRDSSIGAVGPKVLWPDGRLQEAGALMFQDGSSGGFGNFDDPSVAAYNQLCEVDYCSANGLLVRRDAFDKLGGFDRRYAPAYYEDTDLCFGIRTLGMKVIYCPASTVTHFAGTTSGADPDRFKRCIALNREKFRTKWAKALAQQDQSPALTGRIATTADRARLTARARPAKRRVFDCILYSGELDVLCIRLHELAEVVDYFVIVESDTTFSGYPRAISYDPLEPRLAPFAGKIRHVVVADMPPTRNPWEREAWQRNAVLRGVPDAAAGDLIVMSDVDEIPRATAVLEMAHDPNHQCFGLQLAFYYFFVNYQNITGPEAMSVCAVAAERGLLEIIPPDALRQAVRKGKIPARIFSDAGWHFSYLGDEAAIRRKIAAFSHQEFNREDFLSSLDISGIVRRSEDLFKRPGYRWGLVKADGLPGWLRCQPKLMSRFYYPPEGPALTATEVPAAIHAGMSADAGPAGKQMESLAR